MPSPPNKPLGWAVICAGLYHSKPCILRDLYESKEEAEQQAAAKRSNGLQWKVRVVSLHVHTEAGQEHLEEVHAQVAELAKQQKKP